MLLQCRITGLSGYLFLWSIIMRKLYGELIRWAFQRFYREFAWTYDTVAAVVSGGHWRSWVLAALPHLRGRVLELGCGTGNLQYALAPRSDHVAIGLDLSPQMLGLARRRLAQKGIHPRLVQSDARLLPFPDAAFDTVIATFPSEYIAAPQTLAEIQRILCSDGQLLIILGAQLSGSGLYERLIELAYRITLQHPPTRATAAPASRPTSQATWLLQKLEQAGFLVHDAWLPAPGGMIYMLFGSSQSHGTHY